MAAFEEQALKDVPWLMNLTEWIFCILDKQNLLNKKLLIFLVIFFGGFFSIAAFGLRISLELNNEATDFGFKFARLYLLRNSCSAEIEQHKLTEVDE